MKTLSNYLLGFGLLCLSQVSLALSAGQAAPAFTVPASPVNPSLQLQDFKGKVIYLDFWASWCPPCAKSFPLLNKLRAELNTPTFEVVGINVDSKLSDMQAFLKKCPVDFVTAWDKKSQVPEEYGILGMPTGFLIDKKGVIRHVHIGFHNKDVASLRKKIKQLLQE